MALLAGLGTCAKHLSKQGIDPLQVVLFRNLFCVLIMLPLLHWRGVSLLQSEQIGLYGLRVFMSLLSMAAWFHALALIPFSQLTAISFLSPLFGTLCAVLLLGEIVGGRRWTALAVGFAGAMIILRPGGSEFGVGQLLALFAAFSAGLVAPMVKQLTAKDDPDKIVFITNAMMTPVSLVPAIFVWKWPDSHLWPVIIAMGFFAWVGHIALVRGYASTDSSLAQTFEFSRLPFAVAISWIFFGETTDFWSWVGALIIFGSAFYVTRREAQLARERGTVRFVSDPLCATPVPLRF